MPTLNQLRGLKASDRSSEEQRAINSIMGYQEESDTIPVTSTQTTMFNSVREPESDTTSAAIVNSALRYKKHLDSLYNKALEEMNQQYHTDVSGINVQANEYLDKIASDVSSYYKRFKDTDKLPLTGDDKKKLAAEYDARKDAYGEQNADMWLDQQFQRIVGNNQSWWEQMINGVSHLIPAIEGGAIMAFGNVAGGLDYLINGRDENQSQDLSWWNGFMDAILDNPITRYGRDVEHAGASNVTQGFMNLIGLNDESAAERIAATKASATKYNPEGIGADAIVTTPEQEEGLVSSSTPWQALQSGGFTALSMLVGAGEAKLANGFFNYAAKGANWLNSTGKAFKTAESIEKALEGIKKAQNFTNMFIIPGAVGTMEGAMEGLNTKIETQRQAIDNLDNFYTDKINKEAEALFNNNEYNPLYEEVTDQGKTIRRYYSQDEVFQQVWDKYKDEYNEARRQIDWASSKAGIHNFYTNSLINGALNQTLKAGIMAPRVQETLRNSKLFGWAYRNPKFNIDTNYTATAKTSKLGSVLQVLKEPTGEGVEEYLQSLSSDVFSAAAENNINEFIKAKFSPDGNVKVGDTFGSDYAAALTALEESLVNKESIESAILGAVSSVMGTVGGIGTGYHRDENGKLVRNSTFSLQNLRRGLNEKGEQESWAEYARRVTPWRSGAINAYFDHRKEVADANETAAAITEWLKDPKNRAKWDGLTGTAEWMTLMGNAAESNDQFSYRKAQMGKAINDVFILSKLKGTDFYESLMKDLQKASSGEVSAEEIQKIRENGGDEYLGKSDEEVVEKIQSNANKMLGLMTTVEQEGLNLDRLLGRVDEDTKQSLIFGRVMMQDFKERKEQLQQEIDAIKSRIENSRSSNGNLSDELEKLIMKYGTLNKALKAQEQLQEQKEKTEKKIKELEAIDSDKTSDKQKQELVESKKALSRINTELEGFSVLYGEDGKIDSSVSQLVLNEQDIMDLDVVTRAMVLAQGASRLYNATHQNRQKIDQLNLEIDEIDHQIEALEAQKTSWMTSNGKVKKHHNKQVKKNDQRIAELHKQRDAKMRALDAEQGKLDTKPVYNSAQQEVIDNLVQQGMAQDEDFLDKVVDMGRLEQGIRDYHTQYQAILSDPKLFQNYVQRAKYNAKRDLTRRRAERIAGIQDFQEYSQELDRISANSSEEEARIILSTLREHDAKEKARELREQKEAGIENPTYTVSNYDRYMENMGKQNDLIRQFAKNPNLTDNDQSLLLDAMQYLSSKGIDVSDREAAVEALIERDEQGNQGGKFRQWVESKNAAMLPQQRAFMPVFTSIGQIISQYVDLINGSVEDAINRGNISPVITTSDSAQPEVIPATTPTDGATVLSSSDAAPTPAVAQSAEAGIFAAAAASAGAKGPEFADGDGTVTTGSQTTALQDSKVGKEKTHIQQIFEAVTTEKIAKDVSDSANIIENSNENDEVKSLATQYLENVAVNNNERYDTLDELLTGLQEQIIILQGQANMQENPEKNPFYYAQGLLQQVYNSLNAKKIRRRERTAASPSTRPINPRAGWIMSADIVYIRSKNPDAWAVRFHDIHQIDEWNRDHTIALDEPVYFITDSSWSAEVLQQMEIASKNGQSRPYDTLTDMPLVAAVRVETPINPESTTAIEVGGLWYQPICVMPSSKSRVMGAAMTEEIRRRASQEQGRYLVTANSTPNGSPLITYVNGLNYLTAHHPDATTQTQRNNAADNNTDFIEGILDSLPASSYYRLKALSKEELLADSEYQEARAKFLENLVWGGHPKFPDSLAYIPESHRDGETGSPILVFDKPMSETTGRTTDRTLPEVLATETGDEVVTFNSRTERLYNEVIRPLFQYIPLTDKNGGRNARIITEQDVAANPNIFEEEAQRLTTLLNGFDGSNATRGITGISDFIYINPKSGWRILVTAPQSAQTVAGVADSETVYKISFINDDQTIAPISLGEIRVKYQQDNLAAAKEFLRNIMWDANAGQVRDFLKWQIPKTDAQNLKNPDSSNSGKARRNYGSIIDDGILSFAGSSLIYDVDGVQLRVPVASDGNGHTRVVYPIDKVSNTDNANPPAPANITPQGDGAILPANGQPIEPDSGATLGGKPQGTSSQEKSEGEKKAEALTRRIVEDSKQFKLSEDEVYYYVLDKATGTETRYLRVTTVIGADNSLPELTEEQAKRRRVRDYIWTPTIRQIYDKLRERHSFQELTDTQLATFTSTAKMSEDLNIPVEEINSAIAELRTEHKKQKYGAWGTPSSSIGNTTDAITRDFFAGNMKEFYPNITKEALDKFVHQLELFKADLDSRGIHIVPEGVVAQGAITVTNADGTTRLVNVAGTLDLFGYDKNGNFYIFDMKTTRNHSEEKLKEEKAKWSRQISMYADLLRQTYPEFNIDTNNLRIIPIDVDYPTPIGSRDEYLDPNGPQYSEIKEGEKKGQLQTQYRGEKEPSDFNGSNPTMRGTSLENQFQPGYTPFSINWNHLSSEDQDIASTLTTQTADEEHPSEQTPQEAHIEKPKSPVPSFIDMGDYNDDSSQEATPVAPPVVPNGTQSILPKWSSLSKAAKQYLENSDWYITDNASYNEILNNPVSLAALENDLKCRGFI